MACVPVLDRLWLSLKSNLRSPATILTNYDLELADNRPEFPKRLGARLAPDRGVQMVLKGKKGALASPK